MAGGRISLKERLSRLETELDELIRLQESTKVQRVDTASAAQDDQLCEMKQGRGINLTNRGKAMISSHRPCCFHDTGTSAPLTEISKFLQHINLNISKGTQAIAKLATPTQHQDASEKCENNKSCSNNYITKHEQPNYVSTMWKPQDKRINEDAVLRELREEKDKRTRAENQVRSLRNELKKTTLELQQKSESSIGLLQEKLTDTLEKLKQAEQEIKKRDDAYTSAEYIWPLKYETANKDLLIERQKRAEAEDNIRRLQDTLQKLFLDTEEHLTLQKNASWLRNQNESLLCLTKKLRGEIETKDAEIFGKNRSIEDNIRKIKQLINLCGKLRDFLVVTREKLTSTEEKLKQTMEHCQRLSEKMLQAQRHIEDLQRSRLEDKHEHQRLSELLQCSETKSKSLYSRLEGMSEMMKQQNELLARQSNNINNKDEQLKLAYANIKLQSQRLEQLENKIVEFEKSSNAKHNNLMQTELSTMLMDLENEKDKVMIKDKIIADHQKTIAGKKSDLLQKESEINTLKKRLSESEKKLAMEKTTNEELLSKIKNNILRKDELRQRIQDLEEDLLQSSENTEKLEQIENQIRLKQKEWEEFKVKLIKEKNEALEALNCSSQKLSDEKANHEFELNCKQKVVDSLKSVMKEKDIQIEEAKCEIARLEKELQETKEQGEYIKKRFEEGLQAACDTWQKTMLQLKV